MKVHAMQDNNPETEFSPVVNYLNQVLESISTHYNFHKDHLAAQSQKQDQQIEALTASARAVSGSAERLIAEASKGIQAQVRAAVAQSASQELGEMYEQAQATTAHLRSAVDALTRHKAALEGAHRKYALTGIGVIVLAAALAVAGVGAYMASKKRELDELTAQANYLSAYNAADVSIAADGQLLVNIDHKRTATINGKTYYYAKPRE
jgi:hypothetical protein